MGTQMVLMDSPVNGTISPSKDIRTVVWSRAARISAAYLGKRQVLKITDIVNRFNHINGFSQDLSIIYALRLNNEFKIIVRPQLNQIEILDIVNNQNYDPAKVVEITV